MPEMMIEPLKVNFLFLRYVFWGSKSVFLDVYHIFSISIFIVRKISFFFSTLKSILKIKNSKKGLSSSYLATIYYINAKLEIRTTISFRSGGGGSEHSGLSLYSSHTCIYIHIYIHIYIYTNK